MAQAGYDWLIAILNRHQESGMIDRIRQLDAYASEQFSCSLTQLALAWCVKNPHVSTVLLGATKTTQLEENLGALKIIPLITPAHMAAIDNILGNRPDGYMGYGGRGMRSLRTI